MTGLTRAVIDVGTNSVKLLVAKVEGETVIPLFEQSEQTRLGKGFYETHRLQPEAIRRTAEAIAEFSALAATYGASGIRVFATSAARDALNKEELLAAINEASGLSVEIISGEQEAEWVFRGVATHPAFQGRPLLVVDVGGGSTEFVLGSGTQKSFAQSFPLGTVRILEQIQPADPPSRGDFEHCRAWVSNFIQTRILPGIGPELRKLGQGGARLVGTGGTTTIMARIQGQMADFDRDRIDATILTRDQVLAQLHRLWELPLGERQKIVGLPAKRADVILTGAAIFAGIMEEFGFETMQVSARGLRFAAMMESQRKGPEQ